MTQFRFLTIGLVAAVVLTVTACGGGGGSDGGNATPAGNTTFNVVELGDSDDGFSAGVAINDGGVAVGYAGDGSAVRGVKWDVAAPATAIPLQPLPGSLYSAAYGVNASEIAVGESGETVDAVADATTVAVFWTGNGSVAKLPAPPGNQGAYAAYSINDGGQIVGESVNDADGHTIAALWSSAATNATVTSLHQAGWVFSAGYHIHNDGVIVGEAKPVNGQVQGVVWTPAAAGTFVATLLPPAAGDVASVAFGVDGEGRIVGESEAGDGSVRGMIWTVNLLGTVVTSSQTLADHTSLQATNGARLVGYTAALSGNDQAAFWNAAKLLDTKTLVAGFSQAYGLNSSNQIVGMMNNKAFAATPQ